MQLESIEVAAFASYLASVLLFTVETAAANPPIVTDGDGKGVDHIDGIITQLFPMAAQYLDKGHDVMAYSVQTTRIPTFAQHRGNVAALAQEGAASL